MRSANDIHPGAIVAGKYRVRAILGRNHGLTIDAFHTSFDQRAIIKLLLPNQAAAQEIERFRRESRALSKIASEHVARILDVGTEPDGALYLIRQYIDGTDLDKHVRRVGPLPMSDAILFVLQASEAVAEAHANSIVVRDLEPSHLFLTQRTGGAPLIKLADFGTAKLIAGAQEGAGPVEITATAMFGLTPYASPELIRKARDVDARTDVWSLGAILYELLAGKPPFQGEAAALMLQIIREAPQPLSHVRSDVPVELENAIGWALAKDPDARFRNVHAFATSLLPFAPPEGKLLVERIGQITATAREKKASGSVPPPPMSGGGVPLAVPPPRTGSSPGMLAPGSSPGMMAPGSSPGGWVPAPNPPPMPATARLPTDFANVPIDEDAETSIIPGSVNVLAAMKAQYPFAVSGAAGATAPSMPVPKPSSPMLPAHAPEPIAEPSTAPLPPVPPPAPPVREPAPTVIARPPDVGPQTTQSRLLPALVAFCLVGLVAVVVLGVLLIRKQGSSDATATNEAQGNSSAPIVIAVPTNPPTTAATPEPPPPPTATTAAASASAAPSASETVAAADPPPPRTPSPLPPPPPPPPPPPAGGNGTLVAVSVGGPCTFTVNGAGKGTSSSVRLSLKAGAYTVTCKSKSGAKSKAVVVKSGETAMAMFKQ